MHKFAGVMQGAAVCAFDSQTMRLLLRKYVESMLVGCPIYATMPMEVADIVGPAVFEVKYPFVPRFDLVGKLGERIEFSLSNSALPPN